MARIGGGGVGGVCKKEEEEEKEEEDKKVGKKEEPTAERRIDGTYIECLGIVWPCRQLPQIFSIDEQCTSNELRSIYFQKG